MHGCRFEELEHTSEVGVRVHAQTPVGLFTCAARAMFALLQVEPDPRSPATERRVAVYSQDIESLMVEWLGELLYLHETGGLIPSAVEVTDWSPTGLDAVIIGHAPQEPPSMHIKAVTYHQLSVAQTGDGWRADVFFDI